MKIIMIAIVASVIAYFGVGLFTAGENIKALQEDRIKQIEKAIGE